uniref:DNA_MISMATCH_REPAIR_2 domain-containing protein n=1 Tax=Panagrellus redivivus TaxID=6233 RepID=A0A7E4VW45_PANRE
KMQIVDFEKTIVINLQTLILKRANSLCQGVEVAAHLDCLLSLAAVAREYDWHRPKLVDEAVIDVTNARHPLAEMICTLGFVPNPIKSGGQFSKVKLISGPNASGKSVYLKMIGIIAYMASIGSFVPAESVGPINRIISRILLASCMNYWLAKGRESCPHVFASSHFHVLPTLLINADFLSCHTMDIKYTSNTEIDFFYKLVDGSIDNSY